MYINFDRPLSTSTDKIHIPTSEAKQPAEVAKLTVDQSISLAARQRPEKKMPEVSDQRPSTYLPSIDMDIAAIPVSAPDFDAVPQIQQLLIPIRLRIYVDSKGTVKDIRVLQVGSANSEVLDQLQAAFYKTKFIPGRRKGVDMPSYMDLEINFSELDLVVPLPKNE
ncbi:hypothetical protein ACO0KY_13125 [Undibacterium sp. Dicai25W]